MLKVTPDDPDGLIRRKARKAYPCEGNGRTRKGLVHAEGCPLEIHPGDRYVECAWEAALWGSGSRHTIVCAVAFLGLGK